MKKHEVVLVLDFGAQYAQLIARRVREAGVYCEIVPFDISAEALRERKPIGIILSGGPASVYGQGAPHPDDGVFQVGAPVLGICYGMQLIAFHLGGEVHRGEGGEYGRAELFVDENNGLFAGECGGTCWMSHGDRVEKVPPGFVALGRTANTPIAAMGDARRGFYGVQFHPEVAHTPWGRELIRNFLYEACHARGDWTPGSLVDEIVGQVRATVGSGRVVAGLSGGVDSSVAAVLVHRAVGAQLTCIFVDHGLLREGEADEVEQTFSRQFGVRLVRVDARKRFLRRLEGVEDPEDKRKIIGSEFIRVFEEEAAKLGKVDFLVQGTLYPDVIESGGGHSAQARVIKSHHNVGGLPDDMTLSLVEPLRPLFKDEVRRLGEELRLPEEIVWRHPFPGPGLAVRVIGDVTGEKLDVLRRADAIVIEELRRAGLYREVWQCFAVLTGLRTVGVMGDERTYGWTVAIRAVTSEDGMTADWARLPHEVLATMATRVMNEAPGVNRVVYDISPKPPATIEWE